MQRAFRERIGQLSRTSAVGRPIARGSRWFLGVPEGFDRTAVFVSDHPTEQGVLLFDSNQLDGRVATFLLPSPDGSWLRIFNTSMLPNHPVKQAMALIGRPVGSGRTPLALMSESERDALSEAIKADGANGRLD